MIRHLLLAMLLGIFIRASEAAPTQSFQLSVVPSASRPEGQIIFLADTESKEYQVFNVVLTNVSEQTWPVFEAWNSWGFNNVSFDMTLPDGKKFHVVRGEAVFTRNFPSTFLILPGESLVLRVRLDECWKDRPSFADAGLTPVKLTAIYEVGTTPEGTANGVWVGRIESKTYDFVLNHR